MLIEREIGLKEIATSPLQEVKSLTGLRAIAVLLIVAQHCWLTSHRTSPLIETYSRFAASLWFGVDLFFVLSGFLLTRILLATKSHKNYIGNFYARRCLRIWPLYYTLLALGCTLCLLTTAGKLRFYQLSYLTALATFTTNFYLAFTNRWDVAIGGIAVSHLWSLAVEEHFYLIWPWIIRRYNAKQLVKIAVITTLMAAVFRLAALVVTHDCVGLSVCTPLRVDTFCIGGLVACLPALMTVQEMRVKLWTRGFAFTGLALIVMTITTHLFRGNIFVSTAGYPLFAMNFACLIGILVDGDRTDFCSRWLSHPFMLYLGTRSYAIYLFHLPIAGYFNSILFQKRDVSSMEAIVIGIVVPLFLTVILSEISWRLLEKPFLAFKSRFPR